MTIEGQGRDRAGPRMPERVGRARSESGRFSGLDTTPRTLRSKVSRFAMPGIASIL